MLLDRREIVHGGGLVALSAALPKFAQAQPAAGSSQSAADHTIRIGNGLVELAPDHIISTTTYKQTVPRAAAALQGRPADRCRHPQRYRHSRTVTLARPDSSR